MPKLNKPIVIGIGGLSRAGKDTFVKIARKILTEHGYSSIKLAFADALKKEIDPFLIQNYGISAWTDDTEQKKIIRPFLVAHGCAKRQQTNGKYWIEKIDSKILDLMTIQSKDQDQYQYQDHTDVIFISDCRFPNEVDFIHEKWDGWFVHLKKYSINMVIDHDKLSPQCLQFYLDYPELITKNTSKKEYKIYDLAPNAEEAENDPICERKSDARLEMENVINREFRLTGNKITVDSLIYNTYLNEEINLCLLKCPLLTIK